MKSNNEKVKYLQKKQMEKAQRLLEALGFKIGDKFTEYELTDKLIKYRGLKWNEIHGKPYPPNEVIDDLNDIFESGCLDVIYIFARKVQP